LPDVSLRALPDVAPGAPVVDEASRFGVFICEVDGDVADPPVVAGDVAVPADPVVPVAPVLDGEPVVPEVPWAYALPTASELASVSADNAAREVFMRSLLMWWTARWPASCSCNMRATSKAGRRSTAEGRGLALR
jgi:hypothetical protein